MMRPDLINSDISNLNNPGNIQIRSDLLVGNAEFIRFDDILYDKKLLYIQIRLMDKLIRNG